MGVWGERLRRGYLEASERGRTRHRMREGTYPCIQVGVWLRFGGPGPDLPFFATSTGESYHALPTTPPVLPRLVMSASAGIELEKASFLVSSITT